MTNASLPPLTGTATLDVAPFRKGARDALTALREVTDFARKHGTLTLTTKLAGTSANAMRAQLTAALGTQTLPVTISFNAASVQAAVQALRTQLNAVVGLNLSSLTAVQAQINTQIAQLTALIAQLRSLGGGTGGSGGPGAGLGANTRALLADLERLNNEYKRGDVNTSQYATRLAGLQSALRVAAAGATMGTAEFRALDRALTQTTQGLRNVETAKITQLRTELAGARAQFDAAAAAATNLAQRRAAIAAYEGDLNRIRVALQGMASSGQLTAQQLGNVNRLLAQTARESNTINGRINVAGLSGNISNALQQLTGFVPGLSQVTGLFGQMSPAIMGTTVALAAFAAGLASSFRTAAEFQQTMVDIKALTQPTAQGFEDLRTAAMNIGQPLGVGARASAAAILELNRAGLTATDTINGGLIGALNLAGAAGIDAAKASNLAAAAMTAFKLSAEDMPAIADTFANFSNKTFLGAEDLSQAIAAVGPVARTAGLSLNEFSGYMATLARGGFKNMSDAGTSLKTMLLSLQAPSETAAGALETLGLNVYDASGNMRPLADVLEDLRGKLKGLTEQQRNTYLKDIFGTDGIRAATILLGESRDAIDENIKAMGLQGEAARVARERMDTYAGAVKQLGASWETFKITVGEKLLPIMTSLVKGLNTGVNVLQGFANGTENLLPYIAPLVGAFVALKGAAIAAAAPAIWSALLTAIGGFFTTVNAWVASNPLGAIALGVAALAAAVNKIMQDTASVYDQIDQSNQASFEAIMKRVRELTAEGTELSRAQAKVLLAQLQLADAQMGDLKGVNFWGERIYEVDPAKVKAAQDNLTRLQQNLVAVRTEAERHGKIKEGVGGPGLSPEQTKKREEAIAKLREAIEGRAFTFKLAGMSDMGAALAQLDRDFKKLRQEAEKPFAGNLNNSVLLAELGKLEAQRQVEAAAIRKRYADEAVKTARDSALEAQRAEIEAMRDGAVKKAALRQLELQEVQRETAEKVKGLSDFPARQREVEEAGRRQVRALRQKWAEEDRRAAEEASRTLLEISNAARDAEIANIRDEGQRRAAQRQAELADLQRSLSEREKTLAAFPDAQRQAEELSRRQLAALRIKWQQEDEKEARDRAQRLVKAWSQVADAEAQAAAAARGVELAQFELSLQRRLAAVRGDALEVARIEAQAVQERARLVQQAADAQYQDDYRKLYTSLRERLSAENLSSGERSAIWREYYASLSALESKHQADAASRLAQRERDERAAAEAIRQAQIQVANQLVEQSRNRQQQLEWARDLSRSDAEILAINQQISAERAKQIQALQGQLDGVNGVRLTAEERQRVEQQIASLQHDQAVSLKEQADLAREVRQSTLDRLDVEAQLAEKLARTDAERMQAQQRQLAIRQARLRDLDDQIAGEGREKERNALIAQRFNLLGQIADLQDQINNAPFEAEQRRLDLYKAQAQAELVLRGLGEDRVAQANLTVQIAARELLLANQRVAAARTELELQAALSGQASARAAFAQALAAQQQAGQQAAQEAIKRQLDMEDRLLEAQREAQRARQEAIKRQLDMENRLLDAAEARAKAMLQIKGLAGDALASAEQELQVTRERLALTERQLSRTEDPETRAGLLWQRLQLLGQQVEQERKLVEVRAAEEELTRQLGSAEQRLATELRGGSPELEKIEAATRRVGAARGRLAQAEREYAEARAAWRNAPNQENTKALNAATNRLTEAIRNQRSELKALAEEYRSIISQMDGVRGASDRLQKAVYGEEGAPFEDKREVERLQAIASRRDAAAKDLEAALASGDKEAIQRATNDLAEQQERLRKQKELLEKNGYKVNDQSEAWVKDLAKRVDALGIQYDKEAVNLKERARIVDQEAKAFAGFSSSADRFTFGVRQFAETLESTYRQLQVATTQAKEVADAQAARQQARTSPSPTTPAAPGFKELDALAAKIAPAVKPLSDAARTFAGLEATSKAIAAGWGGLERLLQGPPRAPSPPTSTPATQPVTNSTITHKYGPIYITQQPGESADAVANRVISKLEDRARRSGRRC